MLFIKMEDEARQAKETLKRWGSLSSSTKAAYINQNWRPLTDKKAREVCLPQLPVCGL